MSVLTGLRKSAFNVIRGIAKNKGKIVLESATQARRRRRRGRGQTALSKIRETLDVKDVIEHLPVIALLVSRLNGLLNPVASPGESQVTPWPGGSRDDDNHDSHVVPTNAVFICGVKSVP